MKGCTESSRSVRFGEVAEEWFGYLEARRRLKPSTIAGYRFIYNPHVLPTSLRKGELLALRAMNLNTLHKLVTVAESVSGTDVTSPKTAAGLRKVPVPAPLPQRQPPAERW